MKPQITKLSDKGLLERIAYYEKLLYYKPVRSKEARSNWNNELLERQLRSHLNYCKLEAKKRGIFPQ